ncbi:hypothetical protein RHGRI_034316 [Rhododendron griersonianum]|uniref:Uncharacterized protein n=1 Tax=Rhododendron griersonianum TaxID=479676 RepID=A0AAV6I0Z9_9ERIC|nr:hypothetical protein RHGRI_034316 [Rhododendron griersonianum]
MKRDYSSGATLSDEIPAVLRSDPQVREYLRQLNDRMINALRKDVHIEATSIRLRTPSPSRDRNRSPSPQRQASGPVRREDPEFIPGLVSGAGQLQRLPRPV